jgi:hypothetical protein
MHYREEQSHGEADFDLIVPHRFKCRFIGEWSQLKKPWLSSRHASLKQSRRHYRIYQKIRIQKLQLAEDGGRALGRSPAGRVHGLLVSRRPSRRFVPLWSASCSGRICTIG